MQSILCSSVRHLVKPPYAQIFRYVFDVCHRGWLAEYKLVACRRFKGAHTAQNISSMFSDLVQEFGVEDKIKAIVTDNASNMVKAFKQDAGDNLQTTLMFCTHTTAGCQRWTGRGYDQDTQFIAEMFLYCGVTAQVL